MRRLILSGLVFAACTQAPPSSSPLPATAPPAQTSRTTETTLALRDTNGWVESTLASMSIRQRAAQLVVFWHLGDYSSREDSAFAIAQHLVENEGVGGLVMSLGTPMEVATKVNYLQARARVPLIVGSDLEPALMRLESGIFTHYLLETGGATSFPTAMAIAATGRDEDVYAVGRAIAREARAVGIHINFAPTVDVNVNPNNPVIATRSFGEDQRRVAKLSAEFIRGTHDGGALATAKHFPGHGDTEVDSHVGLPVVGANMARLDSVELVPFRAAIAAGTDLVMSSHIALPALGGDSATPATLRPDVMRALLRDSLGFRGVTITDALGMQGIGKGYTIDESPVLALKAGTDILLLGPGDNVVRAIDAVVKAVDRGDLTTQRVDESVRRILWMKARVGLTARRYAPLDSLRDVVGAAAHRALARDIAQRALTLVRDANGVVPFKTPARIAIVQYMPETELKAGRVLALEMQRLRPGTRVVGKLLPNAAQSQLDSVARLLRDVDGIVIAAHVRRVEGEGRTTIPPHIASWIDSVAAGPRAMVVAFGNPYVIRQFPRATAYMNTFGVGDALEWAAARALLGLHPIGGKSPVSLPGFFRAGDGLAR